MNELLFTTSWDDGHPLDLKVAELLAKWRCSGTFYVPYHNCEGPPVLSTRDIRTLDDQFELGSHTRDHVFLTTIDRATVRRQVVEGKLRVEDAIGHELEGFAYPGGKHNAFIRNVVRETGFVYARTVEYFALKTRSDPLLMPTTFQIYPHSTGECLKNFAKRGNWNSRAPALKKVLLQRDLLSKLIGLLELACERGGVLHIWGHSLNLERLQLWGILESFLQEVAQRIPVERRISNLSVYRKTMPTLTQ